MRDLDGRDLDLEHRLAGERADLLGQIKVPELGVIHTRARRVKRRRRAASAAAALALLGTVGAGVGILRNGPAAPPPEVPAGFQSVYRGSGLTMWGLTTPRTDLPGHLYTVEFADARHGYAIAADCPGAGDVCDLAFAVTSDGGRAWHQELLPIDRAPAQSRPVLVAFGTEQVGLIGEKAWVRTGGTWVPLDAASPPPVASVPEGGRLWMRPSDTCDSGPLYVWQTAAGPLATLASSPPIEACRVTPAPGGAWWVGGYIDDPAGRQPAVAVSRDAGRSWQRLDIGAPTADAWAQVSSLGNDLYASVVSPQGGDPETLRLHAVHRSAAGGTFLPHGPNTGSFVGEVVPLLDGRLLIAGSGWYFSDAGGPFVRDTNTLPFVGRLVRTPGGWLALDLFRSGYAAFSRDGFEWHKLNVY